MLDIDRYIARLEYRPVLRIAVQTCRRLPDMHHNMSHLETGSSQWNQPQYIQLVYLPHMLVGPEVP